MSLRGKVMMCDCLVVGSGFSGSVIARRLAEEQNKKVTVIERRSHIAGNMYDEADDNCILVQKYGPHIFHTSNNEIYTWLTLHGEWEPYSLRCMAVLDGIAVPSPFNFRTIDLLYPVLQADIIKRELKAYYSGRVKVTIVEMLTCNNPVIKSYAELLFEKDYRPYTMKQWGVSPEDIDIAVLQRVPVLLSYEDAYYDNDEYQILPKGGFTNFFATLLDHPNITVQTDTDFRSLVELETSTHTMRVKGFPEKIPVVYTGPLDELLGYIHGRLPYRSLRFEYRTEHIDSFQDAPIVAYPQAEGYTRITEYKKLPIQKADGVTTIAVEYPVSYNESNANQHEPYYPIPTEDNIIRHHLYLRDIEDIAELYICGRLADYQYYNMDNAIERAFTVYKTIVRMNGR